MRGFAKLAVLLFGAVALMMQTGGSAQAESRQHAFNAAQPTQVAHQYQRHYQHRAQPKAFFWGKHAYKRAHKHWNKQARRHWKPRRHDHRYMQFHGWRPYASGRVRHLRNAYDHGFVFDRRGHFKRRPDHRGFFWGHQRAW